VFINVDEHPLIISFFFLKIVELDDEIQLSCHQLYHR